jgi:hypothetical protein
VVLCVFITWIFNIFVDIVRQKKGQYTKDKKREVVSNCKMSLESFSLLEIMFVKQVWITTTRSHTRALDGWEIFFYLLFVSHMTNLTFLCKSLKKINLDLSRSVFLVLVVLRGKEDDGGSCFCRKSGIEWRGHKKKCCKQSCLKRERESASWSNNTTV